MKLFVDDQRPFPSHGFECCRDTATAKTLLSLMDFELISLDYDLGKYCETGLDLLQWIYENNLFIPEIIIHSNHSIGKELMYKYCTAHFPNSKVTMRMLP